MGQPEKTERNEEIYRRWREGENATCLAKHFGISAISVGRIIDRMVHREEEKYKHVVANTQTNS